MWDILQESGRLPLLEMATLHKDEFALPVNCWISAETQNKHVPRIKVQQDSASRVNTSNFCSVSISDAPEVLAGKWRLSSKHTQAVMDFIIENCEELLTVWHKENDVRTVVDKIKQRRK